jgi:hypothetical protein
MIRLTCPHCDRRLTAPDSAEGAVCRCPRCGGRVSVAFPAEPALREEAPDSYQRVDYNYERRNRSSELWAWFVGLPLGISLLVPLALTFLMIVFCCGASLFGGAARHHY